MPKTAARSSAVFKLFTKNLTGGVQTPPPSGTRVKVIHKKLSLIIVDIFITIYKRTMDGTFRRSPFSSRMFSCFCFKHFHQRHEQTTVSKGIYIFLFCELDRLHTTFRNICISKNTKTHLHSIQYTYINHVTVNNYYDGMMNE